eukprot:1437742-Pyramimonas_sp.AAC.1
MVPPSARMIFSPGLARILLGSPSTHREIVNTADPCSDCRGCAPPSVEASSSMRPLFWVDGTGHMRPRPQLRLLFSIVPSAGNLSVAR